MVWAYFSRGEDTEVVRLLQKMCIEENKKVTTEKEVIESNRE